MTERPRTTIAENIEHDLRRREEYAQRSAALLGESIGDARAAVGLPRDGIDRRPKIGYGDADE
jgi:hypothetical protein